MRHMPQPVLGQANLARHHGMRDVIAARLTSLQQAQLQVALAMLGTWAADPEGPCRVTAEEQQAVLSTVAALADGAQHADSIERDIQQSQSLCLQNVDDIDSTDSEDDDVPPAPTARTTRSMSRATPAAPRPSALKTCGSGGTRASLAKRVSIATSDEAPASARSPHIRQSAAERTVDAPLKRKGTWSFPGLREVPLRP